jgi:hypothetical protein
MHADMLDCDVLVRRKQNRRLVSAQPLASRIWGMVVIRTCRARNGLTLPPHEPSQFPPVAPARPAGLDRHRAELLAVDDPRDQQRSQSRARKEDRPGHLRSHDDDAAHGRGPPALRTLPPGLPRLRLEPASHPSGTPPPDYRLVRLRPALRGVSPRHHGPARGRQRLHRHSPRPVPPPHAFGREHRAPGACFDGRASRCSA